MKVILLGLMLIAGAMVVDTEQLKSDLSEMERDALAIELYLQDKEDHESYCPHINWSLLILQKVELWDTMKKHQTIWTLLRSIR